MVDHIVVPVEVSSNMVEISIEVANVIDVSSIREHYDGPYIVTPLADVETVLETQDKVMDDDVTVLKIPYYETSNLSGGYTVFIAGEV